MKRQKEDGLGTMRPISELLDFLTHQMSMQTEYQPLVILHLLTRSGWATRADLARTLAGNEIQALEEWDRILMDNPKRWLVGKHQILTYDKTAQTFRLNFDLAPAPTEPKMSQQIRQACITREEAILT